MNFEFFIARRIYSENRGKKRFSRPAVRIAMSGIAIGLAVMIVSLCVVCGFKDEISAKVIGFGSDVQVLNVTASQEYDLPPIVASDSLRKVVESVDGVDRVQRFSLKIGMLKTEEDFRGMTLKGVGEEYDMSFFRKYLVEGEVPAFSADSASNKILISGIMADEMKLKAGDKVFAYFISSAGSSVRARRLEVAGVYRTNLTEYDRTYAFTDLYTVNRLNGWDEDMASGYEISVDNFDRLEETTKSLLYKVNAVPDRNGALYGAFSIKELAPQIFSWLNILDVNVLMILILMICVASFTIISGLLIIMLERINMIGILKALGATNMSVRRVFIDFSVIMVGRGMLWGNAVGLVLCFVQKMFHVVKLDSSVYYIDSVPIQFNWLYIVGINVLTIVISSIVIFGSSFLISVSKPARTMNFE